MEIRDVREAIVNLDERRTYDFLQERLGADSVLRPGIDVLEAGGGSASHIPLPPEHHLTTIDISPEQLAANGTAEEKILGDIETYDFGASRFDLIILYNVLEHVNDPEKAVDNMCRFLRSGGVIVIKGPIIRSPRSIFTKITPHWAHVLIYRHVFKVKRAGQPDSPPFKTVLNRQAEYEHLKSRLEDQGFAQIADRVFESMQIAQIGQFGGIFTWLYRAFRVLCWLGHAGRFHTHATDFIIAYRKPAGRLGEAA